MVDGVAAQVAQPVNVPSGKIGVPVAVKAVLDIAAGNLLVAHTPPCPKAQVGNNQNGLVKLDVQIYPFIVQIAVVHLIHQHRALILSQLRVFAF